MHAEWFKVGTLFEPKKKKRLLIKTELRFDKINNLLFVEDKTLDLDSLKDLFTAEVLFDS